MEFTIGSLEYKWEIQSNGSFTIYTRKKVEQRTLRQKPNKWEVYRKDINEPIFNSCNDMIELVKKKAKLLEELKISLAYKFTKEKYNAPN